ncbi:hypothetical protein EDD86DRAFT_247942 [Gorgonomyces haynaldii]|nr:hypothetical protein EDD86DRAFT_247942 [Gorgonomyces haynaldii]
MLFGLTSFFALVATQLESKDLVKFKEAFKTTSHLAVDKESDTLHTKLRDCGNKIVLDSTKDSSFYDRFDAIQRDDARLDVFVKQLNPDQTIIYSPRLEKRAVKTDVPYSKRPIFEKYVFYNPALLMAIFGTFIVLGVLVFSVNMLSGLQTPTRFDTVKQK